MIRLLRRWADARLIAENERLRQSADERLLVARRIANTLLITRAAVDAAMAVRFNALGAGGQVQQLEAEQAGESIAFYAGSARAIAAVHAAINDALEMKEREQ